MDYRLLHVDDYYRGFLQLLEQLTSVDAANISYNDFIIQYNKIKSFIYVIHDMETDKIVGTGAIFIEHKFIHKLGSVGHIEDVVIDEQYRSKGLGKTLLGKLIEKAKENNCYKIILDCDIKNTSYYEYNGFLNKGNYMAKYI